MFKKCITLITLTAFIIFTFACSSTKYSGLDQVSEYKGQKINITRVQKTTGEEIQFTDASDQINEKYILGEAIVEKEIDRDSIRETIQYYGEKIYKYQMITNDGKHIALRSYDELNEQTVIVKLDEEVLIPLFEVREIEFTKWNRGRGALRGLLWGLGTGTSLAIIGIATAEDLEPEGAYIGFAALNVMGGLLGCCIGVIIGVPEKHILIASIDSFRSDDTEARITTILSERLGEVIDIEERNNYRLFSSIQGFQSAVLLKLPDGRYVFEVITLDETTGEEKIEQVIQTESQIEQIRDYIDQFDK